MVAVPTVELVVPTWVLGNAMLAVTVIVPCTPVPLRLTYENCVPLMPGTVFGTDAWPVKAPSPVAVKFTPNVQLSPVIPLGASVMPEHPSDTIVQFGPGAGPEVVVAVIVPMVIGTEDTFSAVSVRPDVVVPLFAYTEFAEIIEYGVTLSAAYTDTVTAADVLVT
jgi:hypothetical protein